MPGSHHCMLRVRDAHYAAALDCIADSGNAAQFWVTKYPPTSEKHRDLHLMTGFMAGAAADAASKLSEKAIISKTLAQLDKIFGEHPELGSRRLEAPTQALKLRLAGV